MKEVSLLNVIHVDDDFIQLKHVEKDFEKGADGYKFSVKSIKSLAKYKEYMRKAERPDAVIIDVHFEGEKESGIKYAGITKEKWPDTAVIVRTTDHGCVQEALTSGADDFIGKESFEGEICVRTIRAVSVVSGNRKSSNSEKPSSSAFDKFVGETMQAIVGRAQRIVESSVEIVHVFGESGCGKEVVADIFEVIAGKPFVRANCGGINPNLFESELFGAVKGAYTGAEKEVKGLVEAANGGWLFLDEISSLPIECQAKLLRVIENQELKKLGDHKIKKVDVRVISATNENLGDMVREGKFRNDLYQRLCEAEITIPPLRDRPRETRVLIQHFCETAKGGPYKITEPTIRALCSYDWRRGNARELRNCIRAMTENHVDKLLTPMSIPGSLWERITDGARPDDNDETGESPTLIGNKRIVIEWSDNEIPTHGFLSDILVLEMVKRIGSEKGQMTLRDLESVLGLSRTTISDKLKGLVDKKIVTAKELSNIVNIRI